MKVIRESSEEEMLLEFLKGEIASERFRENIEASLIEAGAEKSIILNGDISDASQNEKRKLIMKYFRGYPDKDIFENYPDNIHWQFVEFEKEDLDKLLYIDYCYWNELSGGSSRPEDGAANVLAGRNACNVPNDNFLAAAEFLETGSFSPIIVLGVNSEKLLILEGHVRATAYGMRPEKFAGSKGFFGICDSVELGKKDKRWKCS